MIRKSFLIHSSPLIVLILYLFTIAPGVVQIDSGELAAVASILGVAHPTGYPLFTLIGYLFTKVFFFTSKIHALNILSALYTFGGVFFVLKINKLLLNTLKTETKFQKKQKKKQILTQFDNEVINIIAISSTLITAFSKTFWLQSTSVEVYALHILLISTSIFFFLRAYFNTDTLEDILTKKTLVKEWMTFAFVLGLSFTNHMTSILVLPAMAYLYFDKYKFNFSSFKLILFMLLPFLIALTVYIYLPLAASNNPNINWGNPVDWERFKRHIMGWQYQSWIFSSTESASKQFNYFISIFPAEFAYIGLILYLLGIFQLSRKNRKVLIFLIILFVTCVLYSINYDINDIDSYFLLAFISTGLTITFGLLFLYEQFTHHFQKLKYLFFVFPLIVMIFNYNRVDQSNNTQYQDYTKSILDSADNNSIIISYLWDFFISPSYYFQFVENYRKDVAIIDKELVRRSWYFNQIKRNYPEIYEKSKSFIVNFIPELLKFERNQKYNPQLLETYYRNIIQSFIINNLNERTIYLTPEMVSNEIRNGWLTLPDSLQIIPELFMFRITKDTIYVPLKVKDYKINFMNDNSYYTETLKNLVITTHINRAMYELKYNKIDEARKLTEKILSISPQTQLPQELLKLFQ